MAGWEPVSVGGRQLSSETFVLRAWSASMQVTREQFAGVILGLAVGDALGAPWEGVLGDMIYRMGPAERIVKHASGDTIYYTDDTQMMIGVVQTLIERGSIDKATLAQRFADNYHPDRCYGPGARRVINAIGSGEDWEALAAGLFDGEGSLGNGGAMRVAPLGLYWSGNLQKVSEQAGLSALPTHCHEIGVDGARILAVAAALAARSANMPFDRAGFLSHLLEFAETEEFQWQLGHALRLEPNQSLIAFGNSLEANRSVMTSIMCFVEAPDSYADTVRRAIGSGGDVDTLAAMAGALSGARLGMDRIPKHLLSCLEDDVQGRTFLIELADRLWQCYQQDVVG